MNNNVCNNNSLFSLNLLVVLSVSTPFLFTNPVCVGAIVKNYVLMFSLSSIIYTTALPVYSQQIKNT